MRFVPNLSRVNVVDFDAETDQSSPSWQLLGRENQLSKIRAAVDSHPEFGQLLEVADVGVGSQVVVVLKGNVSASRRGTLLLDLEAFLKQSLDKGISIWCQPIGDKSSLRKLRGITIDSIRIRDAKDH